VSSSAGSQAQPRPDGDSRTGPPLDGSRRPVAAAPGPRGRPRACPHVPPCPPQQARDRLAARVIAGHPEQGWSLLCNGVVAFDDTGALLPGGSVIEPARETRQAAAGLTQAGHARTVAPVPPGRARDGGLRRPGPATAGAALVTSPSGVTPGWRQHAARLDGGRVSAPAVRPARCLQERMAADAW
jgi:hypothetical protein